VSIFFYRHPRMSTPRRRALPEGRPRRRAWASSGRLLYTKHILAIMAIPYTGLSFAANCNSRSSHGQYTRSSTEHFQYGAVTVTSARLLGQNYRNRNYSTVRKYVLDKHSFFQPNNVILRFLIAHALNTFNRLAA
jgi:hypothetical protein